jgi:hypothetical protein
MNEYIWILEIYTTRNYAQRSVSFDYQYTINGNITIRWIYLKETSGYMYAKLFYIKFMKNNTCY